MRYTVFLHGPLTVDRGTLPYTLTQPPYCWDTDSIPDLDQIKEMLVTFDSIPWRTANELGLIHLYIVAHF